MYVGRTAACLTLSGVLLGAACGSKGENGPAREGAGESGGSASSGSATGGTASAAGSTSVAGAPGASGAAGLGAMAGTGASPSGGGTSSGGTSSGGTSSGGAGMAAAAGSGGERDCGELADGAAEVTETQRSGELPAPRGGAISDGTYTLTARNVYSPAQAGREPSSATLRLTGERYELSRSGGLRETGTFATMSVVLRLNATCPTVTSLGMPYTAMGSTLSLITVSENVEEVFTKE